MRFRLGTPVSAAGSEPNQSNDTFVDALTENFEIERRTIVGTRDACTFGHCRNVDENKTLRSTDEIGRAHV